MKNRKKYTLKYKNKNRYEEVSFYDFEYMKEYLVGLKKSPLACEIKLIITEERMF